MSKEKSLRLFGAGEFNSGTVPGITTEYVRKLISYAHSLKKLTITSIGTSQEGADTDTIKRIALECKMAGTDIHHIGDSEKLPTDWCPLFLHKRLHNITG